MRFVHPEARRRDTLEKAKLKSNEDRVGGRFKQF